MACAALPLSGGVGPAAAAGGGYLTSQFLPPADALQVKVRFMAARPDAVPSLRLAAVAVSTAPPKPGPGAKGGPPASAGDPSRWGKVLDVTACTQSYPDGGEGWCSPTSTSMVGGYWAHDAVPCEPRVRAAVQGVYDWV